MAEINSVEQLLITNAFQRPGVSGGQTAYGGLAASESVNINSTAHATKGFVNLANSFLSIDEANSRMGIGTAPVAGTFISSAVTWNAGGTVFTGLRLNVTNTASAAGSLFYDWQVGGTPISQLSPTGSVVFGGSLVSGNAFQVIGTVANTFPGVLSKFTNASNNGVAVLEIAANNGNRVFQISAYGSGVGTPLGYGAGSCSVTWQGSASGSGFCIYSFNGCDLAIGTTNTKRWAWEAATGNVTHIPTWNAVGTTFTGFLCNVTNTASAAGSLVFDWQVGSGSLLKLTWDGNLGFNGASFGTGTRVIFIGNATVEPSTNPVGGGVLYTLAGALKYRGSGGTVSTIANA